ncbi:hypothetical protein H1D32_10535 [Anaerobacillus sp. CMMVII]|uniref:hypothetical protein n=1 Tax=Anaerobacillus sp. CMMVII TaxID=2755588 RepID=UPI0021B6EBC4|nr:hypothetical protein [Anaerobacillus sp. CMMVII]MCT8138151.1 hypothetical protein [Anaerobacillus sp. CMMVII]
MEWPILLLVIVGIFLFIKVISKIVRIIIVVALLAMIVYFVSSMDFAMIMF